MRNGNIKKKFQFKMNYTLLVLIADFDEKKNDITLNKC